MAESVVVAVDVGGTSIKGALVAADGRIQHSLVQPTPMTDGSQAVVRSVRDVVRQLVLAAEDAVAVGVVVPGAVDSAAGVASYSANLGWRDVPLREIVSGDTGLPTAVDHDIRAGGLAEHTIGRSRDIDDSVVLIIGTGIAGLIMSGGSFTRGALGIAGEIGHMPVCPDGEACPCGQRGCLERYASAAAVSRRYAERTGTAATAEQVVARISQDAAAAQVWDEATTALGVALASCAMLLDPATIVLAGGLSAAGDALLLPVRSELEDRVVWRPVPSVELSSLGGQAGTLGAAILAWRLAGMTDFSSWAPADTA